MLPSSMHQIECREPGPPGVMAWLEHKLPVPDSDEVLIKVAAAGVNRADILQRQGKYPPPPGSSDILGLEVAGEVVAAGNSVKRWKVGDSVCALLTGGGYAEYAVAPEGQCLPVPEGLSLAEAAALPEAIFTVWANLFEAGNLQPGETALVHGGSSGIGTFAIQMAKAHNARIFVTAGTDEKCAACKELGADLAINYARQDFVAVLEKETGGKGVNVVLDMIGGDYVQRNLSVLTSRGRHVSIAVQGGTQATVDIWQVMRKRLILTGSTLRSRSRAGKALLAHEIEEKVWPWLVSGTVKPLVYKAFPIRQAAEAHKMMESGVHIGKIILEVTDRC